MVSEAVKKVFIVDDSPIVRERLVSMISELPAVQIIGQAGFAFEAIAAIEELKPDFVVLDISLPGGSGMEVLESIKGKTPAPRVIMLTNFAFEQYRQRCIQLGADYFFDKSNEFEKVMEILRD
jgi:DNA-binding NarL/FixJ family response regulator